MTAQLAAFERELVAVPALVERILTDLPPVEPERVIRCSEENLERAVCRAFARCRAWSEFWRVEVIR